MTNEESSFIEVGEFISPLEKFIRQHKRRRGSESILGLLEAALRLDSQKTELAREREHARRETRVSLAELEMIAELAAEAGEENYGQQYRLMELAQAAAVASCALNARNLFSGRLAVAAKQAGELERARVAYADAIEGLQIRGRLFRSDPSELLSAEQALREGWDKVKPRAEGQREVFDPAGSDVAAEWMDIIMWNSDLGSDHGLLAQADATMRIAIRLEHWTDVRGEAVAPVVEKLRARCEASIGGSMLATRCLVTLADALIEVGQWDLAAQVHRDVVEKAQVDERHPTGIHAVIQESYCHLMRGDVRACQARLKILDTRFLEKMSQLVITVAAELARYYALDRLARCRAGEPEPAGIRGHVNDLLRRVSRIVKTDCTDRVSYLQTLFYAILARDLSALCAPL